MSSQKYSISFLQIRPYILFVTYSFFCILMVNISLKYIGFNDKAAFLAIKQWVINNQIWKTINSGTDAYTNISNVLNENNQPILFYHATFAFRFNLPQIKWNTKINENP